jgi:hypothetical protein
VVAAQTPSNTPVSKESHNGAHAIRLGTENGLELASAFGKHGGKPIGRLLKRRFCRQRI